MIKEFYSFMKSRGVSDTELAKYKGYISPTIIEERQMNIAQMDVYSKLIQERQIFLGCEIDANVSNVINGQLMFLNSVSHEDPITILVNSPGGVCYDGLAIIDTMNYITAPVYTMCVGLAASMGAVILSSGEKGHRMALPHSRVMIHQPLGGAHGQATDIKISYEQIQILKNELIGMLADNSGQPYDKVLADCERDYWMIASQAKEYGLIDNVIYKENI